MKKFSVEEIRKYIVSQDSLGDVMYNLSEKNIEAANRSTECPRCKNNSMVFPSNEDPYCEDCGYPDEDFNDSIGGDHESALASAGWGTNEDYGLYET